MRCKEKEWNGNVRLWEKKGHERGWQQWNVDVCSICWQGYCSLLLAAYSMVWRWLLLGEKAESETSKTEHMPTVQTWQHLPTEENDMLSEKAPLLLTRSIQIKRYVISIMYPSVIVYKNALTSFPSKGHCISYFQDVNELGSILQRLMSHLPIIVIKSYHMSITNNDFSSIVRRSWSKILTIMQTSTLV